MKKVLIVISLLIVMSSLSSCITLSILGALMSSDYDYDEKDTKKESITNRIVDSEEIPDTENMVDSVKTEMTIKNFVFNLPNYWDEEGSKPEYLQYYAKKGESVVMLSIAYEVDSDPNYDVSFKGLMDDNDNMKMVLEMQYTDGDVISDEVFESDYGVKGILYRFTYSQKISLFEKVDGGGYCFCFPSEKDRRWFFVTMLYTNNIPVNTYKNDYLEMLSSIRPK